MKLITKNSQIVVGGVYNLIDKKDKNNSALITISKIEKYTVFSTADISYCHPEDKDSGYYWELVSYPPRRPVTWEWVKENIDQVPGLKFWWDGEEDTIKSVSSEGIYQEDGICLPFVHDPDFNLSIDPPHPEVPDVPDPWEAKTELQARKQNGSVITETWFDENNTVVTEIRFDENKPAEEKKSLWWYVTEQNQTFLFSQYCTEVQFLEDMTLLKYQPVTRPVHEGPEMDKWVEV